MYYDYDYEYNPFIDADSDWFIKNFEENDK